MANHVRDLTNQQFGRLKVIKRAENDKNGRTRWECECACGEKKTVSNSNLIKGRVQSCGCLKQEQLVKIHKKQIVDLTEKRFGLLKVEEEIGRDKSNNVLWKCKCDCGAYKNVSSYALRNGLTKSCGCLKSKREGCIAYYLNALNLSYEKDKVLYDKEHNQMRFDFWVENKYFIEYDGEYHFQTFNSGYGTEEKLLLTRKRDKRKNQYCFENKIPLIRIPYYDYEKIVFEDLILEKTRFLFNQEKEEDYYKKGKKE